MLFKIYSILYLIKKYCEHTKSECLVGKTRLHKLLFLAKNEKNLELGDKFFNFNRFYYGPYSTDIDDVLEYMRYLNLIKIEKKDGYYIYKLTKEGLLDLKDIAIGLKERYPDIYEKLKDALDYVVEKYSDLPIKDLVA